MSDNINFDYKNLSPFKWFVLENFPFIEADFDALTEWQLFCKIGKEINKIIDSQNIVGEQAENLTNSFNTLYNYVHNYFDNLDVQEEINNKLNEMAQDGTLENIINQEIFGNINNQINILNSKNTIIIGDSYGDENIVGIGNSWANQLITKMGLTLNVNAWNFCKSGAGFTRQDNTFLQNLKDNENKIVNKNLVKNIIVCGGYNDRLVTDQSILVTAIQNFINYCKNNYPNAKIYIGMISNCSYYSNIEPSGNVNSIRNVLVNTVLYAYKRCTQFGAIYLNGVEYIMHDYSLFSDDEVHPNNLGALVLGNGIYQALMSGFVYVTYVPNNITINNFIINYHLQNNLLNVKLEGSITLSEPIDKNINLLEIKLGVPNINNGLRFTNTNSIIYCNFVVGLNDGSTKILNGRVFINTDGNITITLYNDLIEDKKITKIVVSTNQTLLNALNF